MRAPTYLVTVQPIEIVTRLGKRFEIDVAAKR